MYFAEKACEWPWNVSKQELGLIGALLHARLNNSFDDALFEKLLRDIASDHRRNAPRRLKRKPQPRMQRGRGSEGSVELSR
jgi:hypothetical protein